MKHYRRALSAALAGTLTLGAAMPALADTADWSRAPAVNADGNYNILFITTDQEHYFPEYPEGTAYRARQLLQAMGVTFEKHYACSNMSTSSRSVIYTGTHIADTHMYDNTDFPWQGALDAHQTTVGDLMQSAGYRTAYAGKWHMGDASILTDSAETVTDLRDYGFESWDREHDCIGSVWEGHETDPDIASNTVRWLTEQGAAINAEGQSFFLAVNLINPHDIMNYNADETFHGAMMPTAAAPDDPLYQKTYDWPVPASWNQNLLDGTLPAAIARYNIGWMAQLGAIDTEAGWRDYQNYYLNCIQDSDDQLMSVLTAVRDLGMLDNTIIVFTADHGEMHGSHGIKGKGGFLFDNNLHVPLIIVHPAYAGGRRVSAVTSHVDLATTLVSMTHVNAQTKTRLLGTLPGENLLELMDGSRERVRAGSLFCFEMLSMTSMEGGSLATGDIRFDFTRKGFVHGVTTERYKFARYFSPLDYNMPTTLEQLYAHNDAVLYDLQSDPAEMVNLAADPEANGALILSMNAELNRLILREIGADNGRRMGAIARALQAKLAAQP